MKRNSALFFFVLFMVTPLCNYAQDGLYNRHFGIDGKVITSIYDYSDYSLSSTLAPDGSIFSTGFYIYDAARPYTGAGYIMKLRPNGTLDHSFANAGVFRDTLAGGMGISSVIVLPDGKLLAVGFSQLAPYPSFLLRFLPNGRYDTLFGKGGKYFLPLPPRLTITDLRMMPDGNIIASLSSFADTTQTDVGLVRLWSDGSLDTSFGTQGYVVHSRKSTFESVDGIVVQSNGSIVLAGRTYTKYDQSYSYMLRLNPNGTADSSFGNKGWVIIRSPKDEGYCALQDIVLSNEGKFVLTGYVYSAIDAINYTNSFLIVRYNANGTPDSSFAGTGMVIPDIYRGEEHAVAAALQPDGKIVVGGNVGAPFPIFQSYIGLLRLHPDGTRDSTFGVDGVIAEDVSGTEGQALSTIHICNDGDILVSGHVWENNVNGMLNVFLAKFLAQKEVTDVEQKGEARFFVSPVPANNLLSVHLPDEYSNTAPMILLKDMLGHTVAQSTFPAPLNTALLANGVYLLRCEIPGVPGKHYTTLVLIQH